MDQTNSRRNFLKGAAVAAAASAAAPAGAAAVHPKMPNKWDKTVDVVVLGAGGAGLMAACLAKDAGASVIVFDKSYSPYHSATRMCGGLFTAYGSKIQREAEAAPDFKGTKDSAEAFAKDIIDYGEHMNIKEVVLAYTRNSGPAFDWMADRGLGEFRLEKYSGHSNLRAIRQLSYSGKDYTDVCVRELEKRKIPMHSGSPLVRFFYDEKDNRVVGVECGLPGKTLTVRARKGVVMATGGITGTPESLDHWVPSVAGKGVSIGCDANNGDALMIAVRDLGVPLSHMQYIASYPCGVVVNGRNGPYCRFWYFTNNGGILISKNGKRFISEKTGICHITPALAFNPDGCHYAFMDAQTWDKTIKEFKIGALFGLPAWTMERVQAEIRLGKNLFKGDSVEAICKLAGIPAAELEQSITKWNKAVETKNDTEFGRKDQTHAIGAGPYYMIRMFPWNNLSCGGLRVTESFQVLNWANQPIKGLFAAGETVAGVHGAFYLGGNACGFAHTSGYVAGQNIMKA